MYMLEEAFSNPLALFAFGAVIGSFLNVVILRHLSGESISGRSHCVHCDHTLSWYELIPILSFVIQAGRCRNCGRKVSLQYPIVELCSGMAAVLLFPNILGFVIFSVLLVLFVIDLYSYLLPDFFVVLLSVVVFLTGTVSLPGMIVGSGFLLFLWAITSGQGIGFGDVKVMIPIGLLFGLADTILVLALAFVLGGSVGAYLLLTKKATRKTAIPFGPYLAGVAMVFLVFPQVVASLREFFLFI